MHQPHHFKIRPGYGSKLLLVEFCGDHRADGYPNVGGILQAALDATLAPAISEREVHIALATDRYTGVWSYAGGSYLIDDDTWGLWIHCENNNLQVIGDIERALVDSGCFIKEDANPEDYS